MPALMPGRWDDARSPSPKEMAATGIIAVEIEEATAKVRSGPPGDDEPDYDLPVWAGVLPYRTGFGAPEADPGRRRDEPLPSYISDAMGEP